MKSPLLRLLLSVFCVVISTYIHAANLYVTGQLKAGLHEEKSLDSPIVKIVPTGTSLEIIKQEENISFVKEPGGASGWIDNTYLVENNPTANTQPGNPDTVQALQSELERAKKRIESLTAQTGPAQENENTATLRNEKITAEQQYKTERIKVGELQVQLAELRKRLGQDNDTDSLYKQIDKLTEENKQLEIKLARVNENISASINGQPGATSFTGNVSNSDYWRNVFIAFFLVLTIGMGLGIYIMDIFNRRRHGGFRV